MSKSAPAKSRDAAKEIERLRDEIRRHEHLYYVADDPELSDAAFDRLMNRLKELESAHPHLLTPDSPTQRVGGAPRDGFQQVRHKTPMVSLDNAFSFEALGEFDRRVRELDVAADDRGPALGERERDRRADALGRACDERGSQLEAAFPRHRLEVVCLGGEDLSWR